MSALNPQFIERQKAMYRESWSLIKDCKVYLASHKFQASEKAVELAKSNPQWKSFTDYSINKVLNQIQNIYTVGILEPTLIEFCLTLVYYIDRLWQFRRSELEAEYCRFFQ